MSSAGITFAAVHISTRASNPDGRLGIRSTVYGHKCTVTVLMINMVDHKDRIGDGTGPRVQHSNVQNTVEFNSKGITCTLS